MNDMLSKSSVSFINEIKKELEIEVEIINIYTSLQPVFEYQFNLTVYARLFLMDILQEDFLWLDADLILMPGWDSIFDEFGDRNSADTIIYGVSDSLATREKLLREGNLALSGSNERYINSGVLKVCIREWKKLNPQFSWQQIAADPKSFQFRFPDQDVINFLCAGKISLLPTCYNYIAGDFKPFQQNTLIKHYAGFPKPWKMDRRGKEYFLGIQGAQYFSTNNWIAQHGDAFTHYPIYWQIEEEITSFLRKINPSLAKHAEQIREKTITKLNMRSSIKHKIMKLVTKKLFH
jgi:lipopolysaccharide biosynthesis glycosyltransferase